jgi:hypothetical protein
MPSSAARPKTRSWLAIAFVAVFYIAGVVAGSYALMLFVAAEHKNSQLASAMQQPIGSQAVVVGMLAGVGPLGGQMIGAVEVLDLQKSAWRMTSLALLLVFGGFAIWHFSTKSTSRPPTHGGGVSMEL